MQQAGVTMWDINQLPYYKKELLDEELLTSFGFQLFDFRRECGFTMDEVCAETGIEILELDALECGQSDIDFRVVGKLLDLYGKRMEEYALCFPGLPTVYRKYIRR